MLNTIKTALQHYLTSGDCNDTNELVNVCRAIDELDELLARGVAENEHIFFVPNCSAIGLLNLATYDDYGRLARQNPDVTFEQYADSAREFDLVCLTDETLKSGYYFLRDLWSDNERFGHNNPDGTFKR
jgi:hypothetical protein